MGSDPYIKCPVFETEHFTLRLVTQEDAKDLLACYSDPKARPFFNADNCVQDFCFDTLEQMSETIGFWLEDYRNRVYVRFAVVDKETKKAIGTVEACGVLRVDLASAYETREYILELLNLINEEFFELFGAKQYVIKVIPKATERLAAVKAAGYQPCEWAYDGEEAREDYYCRQKPEEQRQDLGIPPQTPQGLA